MSFHLVRLLWNVKAFLCSEHLSIRPYPVFQQQALGQVYCSLYNRLEQTLLRQNLFVDYRNERYIRYVPEI